MPPLQRYEKSPNASPHFQVESPVADQKSARNTQRSEHQPTMLFAQRFAIHLDLRNKPLRYLTE
jgi:hypothetical protein